MDMEILNNPEFRQKLEAAASMDEVIALFKAEGVEMTAAELEQMMAGEMTEENLDSVAGGSFIRPKRPILNPGPIQPLPPDGWRKKLPWLPHFMKKK